MVGYVNEFLTAKLWALFHDPPHKAYLMFKKKENHEEVARSLFDSVFKFGFSEKCDEIVKRADALAAGFDRWLLTKHVTLNKEYYNILNIFDPSLKAYPEGSLDRIEINEEKFVNELRELNKYCAGNDILRYHVIYSSLENMWFRHNSWISPADTRFPTHTVFDHNYATATMVNWCLEDDRDKISGYLVYIDFPGIQSFINAARKALDYWAGSFLISYTAFSLIEDFLEVLGPDILIMPSMRNNLMYRHWLIKRIRESKIVDRDSLACKLASIWVSTNTYVNLIQPVIPATITLALPPLNKLKIDAKIDGEYEKKLNEITKLANEQDVEDYIYNKFEEKWNMLIDKIKHMSTKGDVHKLFIKKVVEKFEQEFKKCKIKPPRVTIINIEHVIDDLNRRESLKGKIRDLVRELFRVGRDEKIEDTLREILHKILYHILFAYYLKVHDCRSRYRKFLIHTYSVEYSTEKYREGNRWKYCTTCGGNPALKEMELPRDERDYFDVVSKTVEGVSPEEIRTKLRVRLKPGEKLCPLCILKRFMREIVEELFKLDPIAKTPHVPTVDHVANLDVIEIIEKYNEAREILEEYKHKCGDVLSKLKRYPDTVDRELAFERIYACNKKGDEYIKALEEFTLGDLRRKLSQMFREIRGKLSEKYFWAGTLDLRSYYCIVKGDGDYVGRLLQGILNMDIRQYVRKVATSMNLSDAEREYYDRLASFVDNILEVLHEDFSIKKSSLVISPAYHASLSSSLALTAIKDIRTVFMERGCRGFVIYAGGDDLVVLTSSKYVFDIVVETRRNYWGENGFHRNGCLVSAPVVYGRSYSVRFAHVMDPMQVEIEIATKLLEDYAKETSWNVCGVEYRKDTLAISYGRTSLGELANVVKLPLSIGGNIGSIIELLRELWLRILKGELSHGLPIDFDNLYRDAIRSLTADMDKKSRDLILTLIRRLIERNTRRGAREFSWLIDEIGKIVNIIEVNKHEAIHVIEHLMNGLKVLRGFPR